MVSYTPPPECEFIEAHINKNTAKIDWGKILWNNGDPHRSAAPKITALLIDDVWVEREALEKSFGQRFMIECDYWIPRYAVHDDYTPGRGWDFKRGAGISKVKNRK